MKKDLLLKGLVFVLLNVLVMSLLGASFGGGIKSIQAGTIAITSGTTNTATITSVNTSKSYVVCIGVNDAVAGTAGGTGRVALTNATTVTAYRTQTTSNTTIGYVVIEYY